MAVSIRPFAESDAKDIIDACVAEGWNTFNKRSEDFIKSAQTSTLLVAHDGPVFAGFIRAISDGEITTFVCELLVTEEYRGQGIGTMLLYHIQTLFPKTRIDLISDADEFYSKLSFRKVGKGFRRYSWEA